MSSLERLLSATDAYASLSENEEETFVVTEQPSSIVNCHMRNYQIEGLDWLAQLVRHGFNGILADEMGLGKTLQSIALIALARERDWEESKLPHLIVVPKTTIDNWLREFSKFAPNFKCVSLIGAADERESILNTLRNGSLFDVLITSFDICRIEISAIRKFQFGFFILDEAHRIKNEESILSTVVRSLKSERTFLLTGTPLQNNLHELWAILNFIMPKIFHSSADFDDILTLADTTNVAAMLHRVLKPFMLRRLKTDVARDLPPKKELYVYVSLSPLQKQVYKDIILRNADSILNANNLVGKTRLVNTLMQLRKCCNHPYLFPGIEPGPPFLDGDHLVENSGKLVVLDKLIDRILADSSNQILIFSQMTKLLDILDDYCRYKGIEHCRIDGSTVMSDRVAQIDEFSREKSSKKIFLLSTRAGGLGINLVSANFVFLFDADFNPQSDLQAIDRAHRIGQKRPVTIYRFVTRNTVEEKIVEKAAKKLLIDKMVKQETKEEIGTILKFGVSELFATDVAAESSSLETLLEFSEKKTAEMTADLKRFDEFVLRLDNSYLPEEVVKAAETAGANEQPAFEEIVGPRERKPVLPIESTKSRVVPILKTRLAQWRAKVGGGHEYQFFQDKRLDVLEKKKNLSAKEKSEQTRLLAEGFPHWSKRHFQTVTKMLEEFGSEEATIEKIIAALPERKPEDIRRYVEVLFGSGQIFLGQPFMSRFLQKVKRVEKNNELVEKQMDALRRRVPSDDHKDVSDEVILCGLSIFGYGNWSAVKQMLRVHPKLALDFELQQQAKDTVKDRADYLLKDVLDKFPPKKISKKSLI